MVYMFKKIRKNILFALCLAIPAHSLALTFPLPAKGDDIVGHIQTIMSKKGDTLSSLGMNYNIGYYEMLEANQLLPKHSKLSRGTSVIIPSQFILPSVREGLVVNLAELRVYYFPQNEPTVHIFPIGAGKKGWVTPDGVTSVVKKVKHPSWTVPESILKESARQGKILPKVVPSGPQNPLGDYALRLGMPGILLHGTRAPASVGQRSSHGCMRLLASDIKFLYENVPVGTTVHIIHESHKLGWLNNQLYLEAEVPFMEYDQDVDVLNAKIYQQLVLRPVTVNWQLVADVLDEEDGMPHVITNPQAQLISYFTLAPRKLIK